MSRVEDQLKAYGAWVRETHGDQASGSGQQARDHVPGTLPTTGGGGRVPRRWLVAAAVATVIALIIGVVALNRDDEPEGLVTQPPTDSTFGYEPGWHDLDPGPLSPRYGAATVWTGEELYVVGGTADDGTLLTDGAAYNPATRAWRGLATIPAPGDELGGTFDAVWTGDEILLAYQSGLTQVSLPPQQTRRVATYDPVKDAWTATESWTDGKSMTFGVASYDLHWTGTELLFADALDAYDPVANTFRNLYTDEERMIQVPDGQANYFIPAHPRRSAWTGTELLIFDGSGLGGETIAINPVTGTKRELTSRPAVPPITTPQVSDNPDSQPTDEDLNEMGDAVWHDGEVVDVDTFGRVATYDLEADAWTTTRVASASDDQLCRPQATVVADRVIVDHCGSIYAENDGEWSVLADGGGCCVSTSVSTGRTLLQWSGYQYQGGDEATFETSFRIWVPGDGDADDPSPTSPVTQASIPPTTSASPYGPDTSAPTDVSTVNPPCADFGYRDDIDHAPWDVRYFNPDRAWYQVGTGTFRPGAAGDASSTPDMVFHTGDSEPLRNGAAVRDEFPMSTDVGDPIDAALDQDLTVYVQDPGDEWSLAVAARPNGKILFLGDCLDQLYGEDFQALFADTQDSIGGEFGTPQALFVALASGRLDANDLVDPTTTVPDDNCPQPQSDEPTRAFLRTAVEPGSEAPSVRVEYPAYPGSTVGGVITVTRPDGSTFETEMVDAVDGDVAELWPLHNADELLVTSEETYVFELQLQLIIASEESPDGIPIQTLTAHVETEAREIASAEEIEFVIDADTTPPGSCAIYGETSD